MRTLFDVNEIPKEMRQYFEEVDVICGAPRERVVEKENDDRPIRDGSNTKAAVNGPTGIERRLGSNGWNLPTKQSITTGWKPTCACNAEATPAVICDPFSGSGTTGIVAASLGRDYIGIDISSEYIDMADKRIGNTEPALFSLD